MKGKKPKIRLVRQENRTSGCGPACIAMLAEITYEDAVQVVFGEARKRKLGTDLIDLKRALDKLGVPYAARAKRAFRWENLPPLSIVCVDWRDDGGWHWVIYDREADQIFDPLLSSPTPSEGYRKDLTSALAVWT